MKNARHIIPLFAVLLLAGCLSLKSNAPPVTTYNLRAGAPMSEGKGIAVAVEEPTVPAGMDTERIILSLDGGRRQDHYAGAAWPESLPKVLQRLLIQSAPRGIVAASPEQDIAARYVLQTDIREFGPVYAAGPDGVPEIRIAAKFKLLRAEGRSHTMVFSRQASMPATANTMTAITADMEKLAGEFFAEEFQKAGGTIARVNGSQKNLK